MCSTHCALKCSVHVKHAPLCMRQGPNTWYCAWHAQYHAQYAIGAPRRLTAANCEPNKDATDHHVNHRRPLSPQDWSPTHEDLCRHNVRYLGLWRTKPNQTMISTRVPATTMWTTDAFYRCQGGRRLCTVRATDAHYCAPKGAFSYDVHGLARPPPAASKTAGDFCHRLGVPRLQLALAATSSSTTRVPKHSSSTTVGGSTPPSSETTPSVFLTTFLGHNSLSQHR